jgi:imidazole glycerol-phosphate synthase subunit HisH
MISEIAIVDYGMGNLGSISNMLKRIGISSRIASNPSELEAAQKIILPGVGHFDAAMVKLDASGLREALDRKALVERVPVLGICLGMQMLTRSSEEGCRPGLGWLPAKTVRFNLGQNSELKIPHMGWNTVTASGASPLVQNLDKDCRFYFVHSFHVVVDDEENSLLKTEYGYSFDSAIHSGNIYGAQFHPEKSHRYGMKLLSNFAAI